MVARRQVTESGAYDLGMDELPHDEQYLQYQAAYWNTPKRCALWEVDPEALEVSFVLDLPSNGDTCFPDVLELGEGSFELYDYTSPSDDPELSWIEGQQGPTSIHRLQLDWQG